MAHVGYNQALAGSANAYVEIVEQVVSVHIACPIAELNEADSFVRREGRVHVNVRFAATIIRVIEQDKVARALEGISAKTVPQPRTLGNEGLVN